MPVESDLKSLITRALGAAEAERALTFEVSDLTVLRTTAEQLMRMTPPDSGNCVLMSAAWALHLRDRYNLPAVAITGDLKAGNHWGFRASNDLPEPKQTGSMIPLGWRGHCWVEVAGLICDISIFRTVYRQPLNSDTRKFFERHFGTDRGAFIGRPDEMPDGLQYRRRAVLTASQMVGFFEGFRVAIEGRQQRG